MSKSTARKYRERLVKQGKSDPAMMRGNWNGVNHQLKVVPNKKKNIIPDYDCNRVTSTLVVGL